MTTTLLIESIPLPITIPALIPMTEKQFYEFCLANPELRIERTAQGDVIVMAPAFADTGSRNFNIAVQLGIWTEQDGTGVGFDSSAGFKLPNGATRAPDAAWVKASRWHQLSPEQQASFAPICPDFVIELRSASDRLTTLQAKMQEYIENGAVLGFLIDRQSRIVYRYRPNQLPEILENPATVSADPELPGFALKMAKIW
jgi:Uma2 family endonuclease